MEDAKLLSSFKKNIGIITFLMFESQQLWIMIKFQNEIFELMTLQLMLITTLFSLKTISGVSRVISKNSYGKEEVKTKVFKSVKKTLGLIAFTVFQFQQLWCILYIRDRTVDCLRLQFYLMAACFGIKVIGSVASHSVKAKGGGKEDDERNN